jgi:peptidoglycan/LPS O-acetylase OafA/YrhL
MPAAERGSPAHLDALTGIRGIAAWLVVLYHIRMSLLGIMPIPVLKVLAKGYLAVDLFFILSGFVLWYNYAPRGYGRCTSSCWACSWSSRWRSSLPVAMPPSIHSVNCRCMCC